MYLQEFSGNVLSLLKIVFEADWNFSIQERASSFVEILIRKVLSEQFSPIFDDSHTAYK